MDQTEIFQIQLNYYFAKNKKNQLNDLDLAAILHVVGNWSLFTARKRSLGQGNIFRSVCQEFCSQGGVPGRVPPGTRYTPWDQVHPPRTRYTPQDQVHPQDQAHPLGPGTPPRTRYPPASLGPGTTPDQVHPRPCTPPRPGTPPGPGTPPEQCMLGDTGNKRAVHILLECILVVSVLLLRQSTKKG